MSNPAPTPEPTTDPTPTPAATGGTPAPASFSQEQVDQIIRDRLDRQQRAIDAKAAKDKSEAEATALAEQGKYKELAEAAKREADELRVQVARRDHADLQRAVATEHKLPESLAARLQGSTREELDADAKELAKLITAPEPTPGNRAGPRPQPGPTTDERTEAYQRAQPRYQAI